MTQLIFDPVNLAKKLRLFDFESENSALKRAHRTQLTVSQQATLERRLSARV